MPGELEFMGRGVSVCATCDAFFFRGKDVVVLGGGDTAVEEAIFLTKHVNSVRIVHRRDKLRAQKIIQERAFANSKISFEWDSVVESINGREHVVGVTLRNVKTGDKKDIPCDGVFVFIGWDPNTAYLKDLLSLDDKGYIVVDHKMAASVPGIFAAGEVRAQTSRQAITSAGDGATAAINADIWLSEIGE